MKVVLKVPDMSCGHCVQRIHAALEELGVEGVVNLELRTVTVDASEESAVRVKLAGIDYPPEG